MPNAREFSIRRTSPWPVDSHANAPASFFPDRGSGRDARRSARQNVIDKFLFLAHRLVDAKRIEAFTLAEAAPEQRLCVALKPNSRSRRGLQLKNAADLQGGDVGKDELALFDDALDGDIRASDLTSICRVQAGSRTAASLDKSRPSC